MNLLADTTLIAVEQQARKVGAEMAKTGGPSDPGKVAEIGNMTRGLALDSKISAALYRGYTTGYQEAV